MIPEDMEAKVEAELSRTARTRLTDRQKEILGRQIAALQDDARAFDATAELFRPEWDACWSEGSAGKGQMIDGERASQLRPLVLTGVSNAKYNRELAGAIRILMEN
jgi:hypothetical protein